jgi:TRAP transporter 4TM/12TM fusion protein
MRELKGVPGAVALALTVGGLAACVFFIWRIAIGEWVMFTRTYYYGIYAAFAPLAYLLYPISKSAPKDKIPWYDSLLAAACFGIFLYFAINGLEITLTGWAFFAPTHATVLAIISIPLLVEGARRTTGPVFAIIVVAFLFFPMYTQFLPRILSGVSFDFVPLMRIHALGSDSICGIPIRVVGEILIGFFVFGVVMTKTGAGKFFLDFSMALLGHTRGGPAKVACISSGFFGSMSGSVLANVVTTGSFTIPAMKRTGLPSTLAGAVEACASTGGVLMPPVMGATAFVMASILGMPYNKVAIAAAVPSILYYFSLFIGIDCFAARTGLKGMPREECPSIIATLKGGWIYIVAFLMLIYMLFWMRWVAWAPFYASAALIVLAMLRKSTRLSLGGFVDLIKSIGITIALLTPAMGVVGIIIGSLSMTGVAHAFSREILSLAGGSVPLLLILGAMTSFVLGMGMTITACYVFLGITLAPALEQSGLETMAIHLFILYYAMLSYITPPVAFGAYTAATIAGSDMMRTGVEAVKLGLILFIIPFAFVLNPGLVLEASVGTILVQILPAFVGAWLLACGLKGYLTGIGPVHRFLRILLIAAGIMLLISSWNLLWVGLGIGAAAFAAIVLHQRRFRKRNAVV